MPRLTLLSTSLRPRRSRGNNLIRAFSFAICLLLSLTFALPARATVLDLIKTNLDLAGGATELPGDNPVDLPTLVGKIIKVGLTLVGTIFLVLIVYAGFVWILARGREEEVQKAQKIIETSIIGLLVVFLAYAISTFVFSVLIGST